MVSPQISWGGGIGSPDFPNKHGLYASSMAWQGKVNARWLPRNRGPRHQWGHRSGSTETQPHDHTFMSAERWRKGGGVRTGTPGLQSGKKAPTLWYITITARSKGSRGLLRIPDLTKNTEPNSHTWHQNPHKRKLVKRWLASIYMKTMCSLWSIKM